MAALERVVDEIARWTVERCDARQCYEAVWVTRSVDEGWGWTVEAPTRLMEFDFFFFYPGCQRTAAEVAAKLVGAATGEGWTL